MLHEAEGSGWSLHYVLDRLRHIAAQADVDRLLDINLTQKMLCGARPTCT